MCNGGIDVAIVGGSWSTVVRMPQIVDMERGTMRAESLWRSIPESRMSMSATPRDARGARVESGQCIMRVGDGARSFEVGVVGRSSSGDLWEQNLLQ